MGVYNTIIIKNFKCYYCGEKSDVEFQTKDGEEVFMHTYKKGDIYDKQKQLKFLNAIGSCEEIECQIQAAAESVWTSGYYGGFSRSFDVKIYLDNKGRITNKVKLLHLHNHKGIFHGKLGELSKENNYQYKSQKRKGKNFNKTWLAKKVKITTNGWLDKFQDDKSRWSYDTGKPIYEAIMYILNLNDGEEAFEKWFILRHKLKRMFITIKEKLKLKDDEEYASLFLSNNMLDIIEFCENNEKRRKDDKSC